MLGLACEFFIEVKMATNASNNLATLTQTVSRARTDFKKLAKIHKAVDFEREASFAMQLLAANDYLMQIALGDKDSLTTAVLNVAAIGLSLSPVHKLAYLVPRKKKVCLDISYRGFIQLATEAGAIKWATADIVHQNDTFELQGLSAEPVHKRDPFGERGKIVGAYCVAKTTDNEYLVASMSIDEIYSIRDRSEAYKAGRGGPWSTDEGEMIKKTVIRRAYKTWPMVDRKRLDKAVDLSNDADQIDFSNQAAKAVDDHSGTRILELLKELDRTEKQFVAHLTRAFKRDIKAISELTEIETNQAIIMLDGFIADKKAKGAVNENAG
jgi:recombination protein RecT